MFKPQAERAFRLGLVVANWSANNLQAKPEQLQGAWSRRWRQAERPAVVRWYLSDNRRLAEVEAW